MAAISHVHALHVPDQIDVILADIVQPATKADTYTGVSLSSLPHIRQ